MIVAPAPISTSVSVVSGPIVGALADRGRAVQLGVRQQGDVAGELDGRSTQVVFGSTIVTPSRISRRGSGG